ncbi:flagellar hook assembly protein FlgD [Chitinimonas sp. BJB300]|uniref:flagellar hook assembly protein FlgD n=1 Tax=Chitinimonas sp. BJB300 TaxID=1559339 RepID=UPI000C11FF67|nr:flagellar hook capping FlgD N-terminal domain-containing protein [Chitinimonas sp. BJB300]PHV12869.1 flagellar hook capping protein [Chitinimonas sp. BJB300]TSJ86099.1 flagellar hook capping protein [Chitinimonas sp. BJB300]
MALDSIGASSALQGAGLGLQDLLKILLTQLTYQDPLKPMDNQEFVAQIAQFSSLEATRQLNDKTDQQISILATSQSIGLLGKTVDIELPSGAVSGQVTGLSLKDGSPNLTIKKADGQVVAGIAFSQIAAVR